MKKTKIFISSGAVALSALLGANVVNAFSYDTTSIFSAGNPIKTGFSTCVQSDVLKEQGAYNIYLWNSLNDYDALAAWPGVAMQNTGSDVYCYALSAEDNRDYNYLIFNGGGKQTVNLLAVSDSGDIVNSLVYLFDESDVQYDGNYRGRWAINDTSALVDMVSAAKALDPTKYTLATYAAVEAALGDDVAVDDVTLENQNDYNLGADYISKLTFDHDVLNKLMIQNSGEDYSSAYLSAYNALGNAMNNLEERKAIVINDDIQNGSVEATYESNSDSAISIQASPDTGYSLESITIKNIVSYDQSGAPVFGDVFNVNVDPSIHQYEYAIEDSDILGVYIDATFKAESSPEEPDDGSEEAEDESASTDTSDSADSANVAVPDTGAGQKALQIVTASLVSGVTVATILGAILAATSRKKISK